MRFSYGHNVYNMFLRRGYGPKLEQPGIYCLKIDEQIVYIGKSTNILKRLAFHYVGMKTESERKYRILAEAKRKGHTVSCSVLYYAKKTGEALDEEIGEKEGEYIRSYLPALNTQIPRADDWHKYDFNYNATTVTLEDIISKRKGEKKNGKL